MQALKRYIRFWSLGPIIGAGYCFGSSLYFIAMQATEDEAIFAAPSDFTIQSTPFVPLAVCRMCRSPAMAT